MIGGYFGLMGGAFCVGSLAGAVRSEVEVLYLLLSALLTFAEHCRTSRIDG